MKRKIITWLCNSDLYWEIVIRDNLTCKICDRKGKVINGRAVCGKKYGKWIAMEIDHQNPLFFNGINEINNLQLTCRRCNRSKGWNNAL